MPFKNSKQRAACYAQKRRDEAAGIKPRWDCKKWDKETTCGAVCKDGSRCARVVSGKGKCWQHRR